MKTQTQSASPARRLPPPDWNADKGRKHEAFDNAGVGCDRRSMARAMRLDRKR